MSASFGLIDCRFYSLVVVVSIAARGFNINYNMLVFETLGPVANDRRWNLLRCGWHR